MQSKPLVSVVMPVYGVEKYIENSVKSVIAQTYDNIELILVDDGSPDNSVGVAEKVLKGSNYPYILIRQENQGQGSARNNGLKNSHGEWIVFLDADDIILPDTVKELVSVILDNDVDLVFSDYQTIYSTDEINYDIGVFNKELIDAKSLQYRFLLRKTIVLVAGTLFNRKLIMDNEVVFDNIPWSEDQHFVWKYLSYINKAIHLDTAFYQYLQRSTSVMGSSGIDKMLISYPAFFELDSYYDDNDVVKRFLAARWVIGTLNAAARITEYDSWCSLYERIDGKRHVKTLFSFPDLKVRLAAMLCNAAPKKYYTILRKRK